MKICRNCQPHRRYDDSETMCLGCSSELEDLIDDEVGFQCPANTPLGEDLQRRADLPQPATCPTCGIPVTPGMPFCIEGHPTSRVVPAPVAITRPCITPVTETDKLIPWLTIAGVDVACRHGDVLGRLGTLRPDLFNPYPMVSGCHCAILLVNDQWMLQRLPTGRNPTFVDALPIEPGGLIPLTGIHILQMSSQCTVQISLKPSESA